MASTFFDQSSVTPGRLGQSPLAGQTSLAQFGQGNPEVFGNALNQWRQATQGMSEEEKKLFGPQLMQNLFPSADNQLIQGVLKQNEWMTSKEGMEQMAEMYDKYQTRKGWKSAMFNTLTSGLNDLTKGIAMSMNPYGTPEAARYAADVLGGSGDRMASAFAAVRNPYNIPAVQGGVAPTYF
jgi:hypothetical protein